MALPERDVVLGWVGKAVVDRDGREIGTCTGVFADDATELPEWVWVDLAGVSVFVPLIDAIESGGVVRVAVGHADVAAAPSVGDSRAISQDEEATLYRHYGIDYSRRASGTILPAAAVVEPDGTASAGPGPRSAESTAEPVEPSSPETGGIPESARFGGLADRSWENPSRRGAGVAMPVVGAVGVAVAAVLGARRLQIRHRPSGTRRKIRQARTARISLASRGGELARAAAPLVATGSRALGSGARAGAGA
ncbi:MAG: hypothetical protein ABI808_13290, partial [Pseudonocardiales bacterium]